MVATEGLPAVAHPLSQGDAFGRAAVAPANVGQADVKAAVLVQRTYSSHGDGRVDRTVYRCLACELEFDAALGLDAADAHMVEVHGHAPLAPVTKQPASPAPATPSHAEIVHVRYHCYQPDGSVVVKTALRCPAACGAEFADMAGIRSHALEAHGWDLQGTDPQGDGTDHNPPEQMPPAEEEQCSDAASTSTSSAGKVSHVSRKLLPDGRVEIQCPVCQELFGGAPDAAQASFLDHLASVHGHALAAQGAAPGSSAEDERLDLLHSDDPQWWHRQRDEARRRLRIISLGSFCGVKFSIQRLGLGDAHMPFDWLRSTAAGLRHFMRNDFRDFFAVATQQDVPGTRLRVFRSERHSFWHDDVTKPEARAKLRRRIERFLSLASAKEDLLFVRSCTSTDELAEAEDLYSALCERFGGTSGNASGGRRVLLVLVVDGQAEFVGPIAHEGYPGIAFYAQPPTANAASNGGEAYSQAVASAIDAALAVPEDSDQSVGFGLLGNQRGADEVPSVACAADLIPGSNQQSTADAVDDCPVAGAQGDGPVAAGLRRPGPLLFCDAGLHSGYEGVACFESPGAPHVDLSD